MDAVRISPCSVRPFDECRLIYLHCIDLRTKKFTPVTSFSCLEICCVAGHFSFPRELAVRRLCCFLWSEGSKAKLMASQSPVLLNVKSSCYFTETDGRNISCVVDFELVGASSGISKLPKPTSMDELENATEDDALTDCCPWLDLTRCLCNCTNFPTKGNVLVSSETIANIPSSDSGESDGDEGDVDCFYEQIIFEDEASDDEEEESPTLYTEYVPLRGSSFHKDCQSTLKKCRELIGVKEAVELRVLPEPDNIRDCNALIIQAKVDSQWDRIGYIPKEKVPKFTAAIRQNELRDFKFKNIRCQYVMSDTPTWTFMASVLVIKTGQWLPNDGKYRYNDNL